MKAAILEKIGAPLTVADIDLPEKLERGQVLVKVLCTGICGSQLQEIDGIKGDPAHLPHLLGHEGCGIVQDIGEGVTTVQRGDKVVMHWRKGEGIEAIPAIYSRRLVDSPKWHHGWPYDIKAGPITTFSEYAVVSENRITSVPKNCPNLLAALFGCALSTALSIIENEAQLRSTDALSIVGCGGVGLALIFAARAVGPPCSIIAFDSSDSKKRLINSLGAIFVRERCLQASFKPFDVTIDTIGHPYGENLIKSGGRYISLQKNGTSAGEFSPYQDIPRYIKLWKWKGLKNWDRLVTHRISLDQINDGIQLMRDGKAGRVMIEMQ